MKRRIHIALALIGLASSLATIYHAETIAQRIEYRWTWAMLERKVQAMEHSREMSELRAHYAFLYGVR